MAMDDTVWRSAELVGRYLGGVRGAIPLAAEQIAVMLRLLDGLERPVARVLDLGCGDGVLAAAVLDRHPAAAAVLLDHSPPMLQAAARRFAGRADRVTLFEADYGDPAWVGRLPPGPPFDAVVSGFSIHHQPDDRKRRVYAEVLFLLRPGGLFVNVEHVASRSAWGERMWDGAMTDALFAFHSARDPSATRERIADEYHRRPDKAANILAPVEDQCAWLREIGFADVDCWMKIFELSVFGGRRPGAGGSPTADRAG
jgi:SAM-dependent methyltransferase